MSSLNVRAEKRRLTTVGVFCPRTTAELGDRPGLVSARMVSFNSLICLDKKPTEAIYCFHKMILTGETAGQCWVQQPQPKEPDNGG